MGDARVGRVETIVTPAAQSRAVRAKMVLTPGTQSRAAKAWTGWPICGWDEQMLKKQRNLTKELRNKNQLSLSIGFVV